MITEEWLREWEKALMELRFSPKKRPHNLETKVMLPSPLWYKFSVPETLSSCTHQIVFIACICPSGCPSFCKAEFGSVCESVLSCVRLSATSWTVTWEAPLSVEFSRQEYWKGLPFPTPGNLPNPGIQPGSPALAVDSLPVCHHHQTPRI